MGAQSFKLPILKPVEDRLPKYTETPTSDLSGYLNWVPNKEKFDLGIFKQNNNGGLNTKLSPLRAGPGSIDEDSRSNMSRSILKMRHKNNHSSFI